MRMITIIVVTLVAVFITASFVMAQESRGSLIYGTVVDTQGKPVANAKIRLSNYSYNEYKRETLCSNKLGGFRSSLRTDKRSSTSATIFKDGFCAVRYSIGNKRPPFEFILLQGFTMKGKVIDENGRPLPGAKIMMCGFPGYKDGATYGTLPWQLANTTTGKDGCFSFPSMPSPENYNAYRFTINISAPGHPLIHRDVSKEEYTNGVIIRAPLEARLLCKILFPETPPLGTELVVVPAAGGDKERYDVKRAFFRANGYVYVTNLIPGKANIYLKGYNTTFSLPMTQVELSSGHTTKMEVVLEPSAVIKGKVVDKDSGKPITVATLDIRHAGIPPGYQNLVTTDIKGEFTTFAAAGPIDIVFQCIDKGAKRLYPRYDQISLLKLILKQGEVKSDIVVEIDTNNLATTMPIPQNNYIYQIEEKNFGRFTSCNDPRKSRQRPAIFASKGILFPHIQTR